MLTNVDTQMGTEEKLARFISENRVDALLIEKGSSEQTLKAHELLKAKGYDVSAAQMIKALVCIPVENEKYLIEKAILAMISGADKLDLVKLAAATGSSKVVIADQVTAEGLSGYPRGGTPPIGHAHPLRVVMDSNLAKQSVLFGGGGETTKVIQITPAEIKRVALASNEEFAEAGIRL